MHNRRHGRVRAQGVASHLRDGAQLITGLAVENLSRGGAFVRSAMPMAIGSPVVLDLVRPGLKRSLQFTGRVVSVVSSEQARERKGSAGMGIRFDPYSPALGERLTELLVALGAGPAVLEADPAESPPADWMPLIEAEVVPPSVSVPDEAKVMMQVKGLLMELGESQASVSRLERENATLKAEVTRLNQWIETLASRLHQVT